MPQFLLGSINKNKIKEATRTGGNIFRRKIEGEFSLRPPRRELPRSMRCAVAPRTVWLNGCSSTRRGACGGPLPARVRITEAAVAGDHLLPAHLQGSHAAILLHDAAADIAQRAPRTRTIGMLSAVVLGVLDHAAPIIHKSLGYFRKIGFVLRIYNCKLSIETDSTIRARTASSRRIAARCSYRSSLRSSGSTRRIASTDR
jgi:hypothetical protein